MRLPWSRPREPRHDHDHGAGGADLDRHTLELLRREWGVVLPDPERTRKRR